MNFFQDKTYLLIIAGIVIIVTAFCLFNYYIKSCIKSTVSDEIKKMYKIMRRRQKIVSKKEDIEEKYPKPQETLPVENHMYVEEDNQSYVDPMAPNNNIEYQNLDRPSNENILMRDIIDNTPNNRFQ
ncbi:hypothetical protein Catovirus_1_935 [Catovirus CTV1]|uniref:Uncharacterized protein n=1 Tax=Catovirus CTV1 TaxID=1977631 RepID=A0A1V0SAZ2_9VIRU|nr:hypothetical protein Catovirus_1_935 [Catovirus CTV1]